VAGISKDKELTDLLGSPALSLVVGLCLCSSSFAHFIFKALYYGLSVYGCHATALAVPNLMKRTFVLGFKAPEKLFWLVSVHRMACQGAL